MVTLTHPANTDPFRRKINIHNIMAGFIVETQGQAPYSAILKKGILVTSPSPDRSTSGACDQQGHGRPVPGYARIMRLSQSEPPGGFQSHSSSPRPTNPANKKTVVNRLFVKGFVRRSMNHPALISIFFPASFLVLGMVIRRTPFL